jgi:hypothetical protein
MGDLAADSLAGGGNRGASPPGFPETDLCAAVTVIVPLALLLFLFDRTGLPRLKQRCAG